ncbi:MAG TPA: DUF6600 domain-containing protein [Stellaceae bacterium]|nr:DUF6600 domain-containing protein [Stellaceae bacterium]
MIARQILFSCLVLLGFLGVPSALAADSEPARVGRLAVVDGDVAAHLPGGEWTGGEVNDPVFSGVQMRTGASGRAILRIGADTVALAAAGTLDVAAFDARGSDIVLHSGRIGIRLSPMDPSRNVEIDLPGGGVWLSAPGDYDITAGDEHTPARVAVFDGRARLVGKGFDTFVDAGSAAALGGGPATANAEKAAADDFVEWWRRAAGDDAAGPAAHFLSPDLTGYEALDSDGTWEMVDGYGAVWFPTTAPAGWAPYRDGHWRWIAPWGWSWIDDMSWGFVTSHYGRWASIPGADPGTERWGWVPGDRVAQPKYAPALVAFLGTAGVGLSYPDASGPAAAWFPLAPGEVYWPSYTSDPAIIRRINDGSVADLDLIGPAEFRGPPAAIVNGKYQNRRFASVVPRAVFLAGLPVASALVQLPSRRLDNAPLLAGSPQLAPPAPHVAAVASVAGNAKRVARATTPRLARAMHALARILARREPARARRALVLAHVAPARSAVRVAIGSHWRAPRLRLLVRPHIISAVASRSARVHLAALHRRWIR